MRPVAEIRADLEHPHVVPLLRTGLGDGPIGRLLRDGCAAAMSRLMSVAFTEQAVVERRKTVTRRKGWCSDKRGRRLLVPATG
jgi:hypothetical protein